MNEIIFGAQPLMDAPDLIKLIVRLIIDLVFVTIVVRAVYFKLYADREYVFTYYLFNIITFSLCFLLRKVPIELGFALGLFAVFGILRYRTEAIRIRDLTYLFIVIGLAILNALANKKISVAELLAVNAIICFATVALERGSKSGREQSKPMLYDRLDLLAPSQRGALLEDLKERTGLTVDRVRIDRLDLLRDAAEVTVYFAEAVE